MKFVSQFIAIAAVALAPMYANAASIGSLDPDQFDDAGTGTISVCGPCVPGTSYTSSLTFEFDIINNDGFINAGASNSITPSTGGTFTNFTYTIERPAGSVLATGTFGSNSSIPPDLYVTPGQYTVTVNWTFVPTTLSSANWSMTITSAPFVEQVPEPGSLALLGLGLVGLAAVRRRK